MNQKLRILFVEDESVDNELAKRILCAEGLDFDSVLVETENEFKNQLHLFHPDIIVSDYEMPVFKGTRALELTQKHDPSLPFIILTGSRNEIIAVECMRLGAWDYVIKDNMKRLPFALKEALYRAETMRQKADALEALAESERKYRSYIELATDGIFVVDENQNFLEVNPAGCKITGYSEEEIMKMSINDFIVDKINLNGTTHFDMVKSTGSAAVEMRFRRKNGSIGWWSINGRKLSDNRFIGYTKDITSGKLSHLSLMESEKKYKSLIDQMSQGLAVHEVIEDENGNVTDYRFLDVNAGFELLTGLKSDDIIGKTVLEVIPDIEKVWIERYGDVVKTGNSIVFQQHSQALHRWYEVIAYRTQSRQFATIFTDITERKESLDALSKSEEKYRLLIENSNDAIVVGLTDKLVFANPKAYALIGYKEELLFNDYVDFIHPEDRQIFVDSYMNLVNNGIPLNKLQVRSIDALNKICWLELSGVVIDWEGQIAVLSFITDITERREAEESLRISESKFRMLFENIPMGIFHYDSNGIILSANDPFIRIIGSSSEKLIDLDLKKLKDEKMVAAINQTLGGSSASYEGVYEAVTSGKIGYIIGKFTSVINDDGTILGGIGIVDDISEQKKAEIELRESQQRFVKSFHSSPASICIIEYENNIILEVNDAWCRLLGYTREMAIGKNADEMIIIEANDKKRISDEINNNNMVQSTEISLDTRANGMITVLISIEFYESDRKRYMLSTMMDITDRKNAEEELVKLTRAVEQSPVSIVITNLDGNIDYVNPKVSEVTGYLPAELIGKNPRILSSGENPASVYREMYKVIKAGGIWHGEFHNKTKSGELIWESASISPVINDEGIMTHYIAVKEDITEWKRMHEILEESEKRYRDMFKGNPLPMYIFEIDSHKFVEVNAATTREYGYNESEFLAMRLEDIHEKNLDSKFIAGLQEDLLENTNIKECVHIRKDGTIVHVEISSHAIVSSDGRNLRLILEKNITEKLNTEKALQHAKELAEASDKLKTTFLNNISHEVRTPLNGIIGAASLIADPDLKSDDHEELVQIITTSTERLIQTITDFMDVSLLTSQNMEVFIRKVQLLKLLERIRQKFEKQLLEKNLKIELRMPDNAGLHYLESDEELIFKSLSHLMANAVKFNDKGKVILGYQIKEDQIEFFVEDNGIGISKDSQSRIFDYFSQEDSSSVRRFEGSGLGLSIVRGIAALLGGNVKLVSTKGLGSTFYFILPAGNLSQSNAPAPAVRKDKIEQPILLIAEDDESNFFVLEVVIKKTTGAKVIRASNGLEAVDFCRENPAISLVLMDIKMPVMDGLEATKEIKAFRPDLPIIAITAYAMSGDEQKALNAGCDDYLAKPVSMKALVAKLENFGLTKISK
jgi:PAS domain S-box-containing protein